VLALPAGITACLFDLDGVLTPTAELHARAWQETFDTFLRGRPERVRPFDPVHDYEELIDGRTRLDGVRAFLASRRLAVAGAGVRALAADKNRRLVDLLGSDGVRPFAGSVRLVAAARDQGLRRAVVSSSRNAGAVLRAAGIADLFEAVVDGMVAQRQRLAGKPAPDTFLAAARLLDARPAAAAVFEDSLAGVEAARAGRFGYVVGVDRRGHAERLRNRGADVVVSDLSALLA
jgi:beta-phosphoglucomutase family hydrolase